MIRPSLALGLFLAIGLPASSAVGSASEAAREAVIALEPWSDRAALAALAADPILSVALGEVLVAKLGAREEDAPTRADLASLLAHVPVAVGARAALLAGERQDEVRLALVLSAVAAPKNEASALLLGVLRGAPDEELQLGAISVASRRPAEPLTAVLLEGLAHAAPDVRAEAARGLGWWRVKEAETALVERLGDPVPAVRWRALEALARIDPARAAAEASLLARDPDPRVRSSSARLVGRAER